MYERPGILLEYYKGIAIFYRNREYFYSGDIDCSHGHKNLQDLYELIDHFRPSVSEEKDKVINNFKNNLNV